MTELQGDDPLSSHWRGAISVQKEHQQHLELAANYPKIAVAYTQVVAIATDDHHTLQEFVDGAERRLPSASDRGVTVRWSGSPNL